MTSDEYQPVSCAMHSEMELAIMRKQKLLIQLKNGMGEIVNEEITPVDLVTCDHAEFLIYKTRSGELKEERLDKIAKALKLE